jgi:molybdenum cofactor guanylyltransferase
MDRSAVILANGISSGLEEDWLLSELHSKPLIRRVADVVKGVAEEVIVVTNSQEQADKYAELLGAGTKFAITSEAATGTLIGALTGFKIAQGKHSLLLAADMGLVSRDVIDLLFELCHGRTAAIPRWPDERIEPLQAVYHTKSALEAGRLALEDGEVDVSVLIENLGGVRYISTLVIQEMDPGLKTFFNVNSPVDLKRAEGLVGIKPKKGVGRKVARVSRR